MRRHFAKLLHAEMATNPAVRLITADLGYGVLDSVRESYPNRSHNVGAAEQLMIGVAVGMANEGLIPFCYSMSSFVLYRPFEFLRNYLNHEHTAVKLIGSGRDRDYEHDGISHWAHDDSVVCAALPHLRMYRPNDLEQLQDYFYDWINSPDPGYLNLMRKI